MLRVAEYAREPYQPLVSAGEIDHHVTDMTVTFAADVTLAKLQAQLAPHNQWLPIDGDSAVPISQLVLRNSTGPLRLGYGAWRDLLLGAQFTNGRGELITVGGRVLKNVAGYDVTKLLVGSYGVFGSPVTFTARTWRRPAGALHVSLSVSAVEKMTSIIASPLKPQWALLRPGALHVSLSVSAVEKMTSIIASPLKPQWALLRPGALHFGYHGDEASIAYFQSHIGALEPTGAACVSIEGDVEFRRNLWSGEFSLRASVPPANLAAFVRDSQLYDFVGDAAFGIVAITHQGTIDIALFREAAKRLRATLLEFDRHGMPRALNLEPATYAILEKLKTAFDPDATLPPLPKNVV